MQKRKSTIFLSFVAVELLALLLVFGDVVYRLRRDAPFLRERMAMVEDFGLTDLCLFTDARYARHPAMADLNTAFQDHPVSLEHFPSGSIIAPPARMRRGLD